MSRAVEKPRQTAKIHFSDPSSKREFAIFDASTRDDALAAILTLAPEIDTVGGMARFRESIDINEFGGGCWDAVVNYSKNPNQFELTFDVGVGSTKIQQALATIRGYNCVSPSSNDTIALAIEAELLAVAVTAAVATLTTAGNTTATASAAARTAAAVGGVDNAVATLVLNCAAEIDNAVTHALVIVDACQQVVTAVNACAEAARQGNWQTATDRATDASVFATIIVERLTSITDAVARATDFADDATTAAGGGNAQTIAAAAAAQAAVTAADALEDAADGASAAATSAKNKAVTTAESSSNDTTPGQNGVPDFRGAINVVDDKVEGLDVDRGKFEFKFSRKMSFTTMRSDYLSYLASVVPSVNDREFTILWQGQSMTFDRGTLLVRGVSIKQDSNDGLDIGFNFSFSRPTRTSDGLRIGNSVAVTKEGWQYLWVYYSKQQDSVTRRNIMVPICATVVRVYEYSDFNQLRLYG